MGCRRECECGLQRSCNIFLAARAPGSAHQIPAYRVSRRMRYHVGFDGRISVGIRDPSRAWDGMRKLFCGDCGGCGCPPECHRNGRFGPGAAAYKGHPTVQTRGIRSYPGDWECSRISFEGFWKATCLSSLHGYVDRNGLRIGFARLHRLRENNMQTIGAYATHIWNLAAHLHVSPQFHAVRESMCLSLPVLHQQSPHNLATNHHVDALRWERLQGCDARQDPPAAHGHALPMRCPCGACRSWQGGLLGRAPLLDAGTRPGLPPRTPPADSAADEGL